MKKLIRLIAITSLLASSMATAAVVDAGPKSCAKRTNDTTEKLRECVTLDAVRAHQQALQAIADANGGIRAAGTPGYDASLAYIEGKLQAAGYVVTRNAFSFNFVPPPLVVQLTPVSTGHESEVMTGTGAGDTTAAVQAVDINLVPPRGNTSGCQGAYTEAAVGQPIVPAAPGGPNDFASFTPGNIALVQRGGCSFALKAVNADAAGATAVIIFNQGDTPAREDLVVGNGVPAAGSTGSYDIPFAGVSFASGSSLAQAGTTARVKVEPAQVVTQNNLIAESVAGDPNNVIMAGAHLDSVRRGPGINDNGSGSAALLETALQMAKVKPINKVRFAWWGAEESGLVGSNAYVAGLSQAERDKIELYLNFDMVGSPNYVFFIYDGDNSDAVGAPAGPPGSAEIEEVFEAYYESVGEPYKGTDFTGRSDYGPFIAVGVDIPSGGLFTGAEGIKTAAEAATWGGTAGLQYDPCYHLPCDTFNNNNNHALDVNSDAIANAVILYAMAVEVLPATAGTTSGGASFDGGDDHDPIE